MFSSKELSENKSESPHDIFEAFDEENNSLYKKHESYYNNSQDQKENQSPFSEMQHPPVQMSGFFDGGGLEFRLALLHIHLSFLCCFPSFKNARITLKRRKPSLRTIDMTGTAVYNLFTKIFYHKNPKKSSVDMISRQNLSDGFSPPCQS